MADKSPRDAWKAANAELVAITAERDALLKPSNQRLADAVDKRAAIEAKIGEFLEPCEGCGEPIFEGDVYSTGSDLEKFCVACSPTWQDMIEAPSLFLDNENEPMTAEQAREEFDAYIAAGGKATDSWATVTG
jgi:hypothetical protein